MEQAINIRLAFLKERLRCNWSQLAARLGVSRQMLGDVRKGTYNFGHANTLKLEALEREALAQQGPDNPEPPLAQQAHEEEMAPYHTSCPQCAIKDAQIDALNEQLKQSQAIALALATGKGATS